MKKKKVILTILLIPVLLLCGALAAYVVMVQRYGHRRYGGGIMRRDMISSDTETFWRVGCQV